MTQPFITNTLQRATSQNGVREHRTNGHADNKGPQVETFQRAVGIPPGSAWCAAFVYWAISEEAKARQLDPPFIRSGYCPDIETWARTRGILHTKPQVGDAFLRIVDGWSSHIGFVTGVNADGSFTTIEGNTNAGLSNEGDGVYDRVRTNKPGAYKFVRWGDLLPKPVTEPAVFHLTINGTVMADMPQIEGRSWVCLRDWAVFWGLTLTWDDDANVAILSGWPVKSQTVLRDGKAYVRLNDLLQGTGLKAVVDVPGRMVTVTGSR